jgi:hypothetical protein
MRYAIIFSLLAMLAAPAQSAERRCGWVSNPTPGNWWFIDKQAKWIIATRRGRDPVGWEKLPEFGQGTWQSTGGATGMGCACMVVDNKLKPKRITRIHSSTVRPLRICGADMALPRP